VVQVNFHLASINPFEMGASDHPGGKGPGGSKLELVKEVALSCKDEWQKGFGIGVTLSQGVQFQEDFQSSREASSRSRAFFCFLPSTDLSDLALDHAGNHGPGGAFRFHLQAPAELPILITTLF
jgi:hypothetical protein